MVARGSIRYANVFMSGTFLSSEIVDVLEDELRNGRRGGRISVDEEELVVRAALRERERKIRPVGLLVAVERRPAEDLAHAGRKRGVGADGERRAGPLEPLHGRRAGLRVVG